MRRSARLAKSGSVTPTVDGSGTTHSGGDASTTVSTASESSDPDGSLGSDPDDLAELEDNENNLLDPADFAGVPLDELDIETRYELAVAAVRNGARQRQAAAQYAVVRTTLQRRLLGIGNYRAGHATQQALSPAQEKILVEWIKIKGKQGVPMSLPTVANAGSVIIDRPLGKTWAQRFKARHSDQLKVVWTQKLESCRARQLNPNTVNPYFDMLEETIHTYSIKCSNIYNMDEKGIQLGDSGRTKVLADRDQKQVRKISDGDQELVTVLESVCADGTALAPTVIFKGVRRDLRWGENNPSNASISLSPRGWTDQYLGAIWMEKEFEPQTALKLEDPSDYRLLILDGHNSHCTYRFLSFAKDHRIIVLCLPPHTTHALQPCDVGVFKPLSTFWKKEVEKVTRAYGAINKYNLLAHYHNARTQAFKPTTIMNSFRKTGIWPVNRHAIDADEFETAKHYTNQATLPTITPADGNISNDVQSSASGPTESFPSVQSGQQSRAPTSNLTGLSTSQSQQTITESNISLEAAAISVAEVDPLIPPSISAPSTPSHNKRPHPTDGLIAAAFRLVAPSPRKGPQSRKALRAENTNLRDVLGGADVEIEKLQTQLKLAAIENAELRQALCAKKSKGNRNLIDGMARNLTASENMEELGAREHRIIYTALHKDIVPLLEEILNWMIARGRVIDSDTVGSNGPASALEQESDGHWLYNVFPPVSLLGRGYVPKRRRGRPAGRGTGRGVRGRGGGSRADSDRGRGDGRGRARGRARGRGHGRARGGSRARAHGRGRGRGLARGHGQDQVDSDSEMIDIDLEFGDEESETERSGDSSGPDTTSGTEELSSTSTGRDAAQSSEDESSMDEGGDQVAEEIEIVAINGHRWVSGDLEFMVIWADDDVTWEPLETVNDCEKLEDYLDARGKTDPLQLGKRRYVLDKAFQASNP
ncbi:unnamed protein product [Mycena citricolor]|uniref:HTH CENPB-type domain-containing protein n=1 Tax=Mycena citricolor TaxID=2018698 RepID=A0AAD2HSU3_9AGAR|nr:unnamed protein product [Mycena citricolor]